MSGTELQAIVLEVEALLSGDDLPGHVERALNLLLNALEELNVDKESLTAEVQRLRKLVDEKKKAKTTGQKDDSSKSSGNHSSEKRRPKDRDNDGKKTPKGNDKRSRKNLAIHETIECPIDPATLPPDAVRVADDIVIVQDIEIKPKNIQFKRQVFYSAKSHKYFRAALPQGYDRGDFGADLRALILSLKYSGNMTEPKIGELLKTFGIEVSGGSISNILTNTATDFEQEYHDVLRAGLSATSFQQTDDTSARVDGEFWHTHILCNNFYTLYSTRPHKDRLSVLKVLQNTDELRFRFGTETLGLLQSKFNLPKKWVPKIQSLGDVELSCTELKTQLDDWFGEKNKQLRTNIEQASAIVYYRHQSALPVVETLVCDDAGQFKLLTDKLSLCWIHAGRHFHKLSPVVPKFSLALDSFLDRYWEYYSALQDYRAGPTDKAATQLRLEFDELFSKSTGYEALDERIKRTAIKKDELLTVLSRPTVPLHNNASELGARVSARRRDVSLHSRSQRGARAMDIFTTIVQTAKKLEVNAYQYLRDRVSGLNLLPSLAQKIKNAASG